MAKAFASQADLEAKQVTFTQLSPNAYAYTAEGDPNSGVIIGDDAVLIVDTTATPAMAQDLIARIRAITDKPIKHVVLSHYHAVRVLGASAYFAEGAQNIIASRGTHEMIVERGEADMKSEIERFPRLFAGVETVPGLTWPTLVFERELTLFLGQLEVKILHLGPGHTKGDTVVWIPSQRVLFSGDLVDTTPPATAAMRSSKSGPPRWMRCAHSAPTSSCPAAALRCSIRPKSTRASRTRVISSRHCLTLAAKPWRRRWTSRPPWPTPARQWTRSSATSSSTSTACRLTSPAPLMKPAASSTRASGRRSAIRRCGPRCRTEPTNKAAARTAAGVSET